MDFCIREQNSEGYLPLNEWALCASLKSDSDDRVNVGVLLRLREDEIAFDINSSKLRVPWLAISQLSQTEAKSVGLPQRAPLSLEIRASGAPKLSRHQQLHLCQDRNSRRLSENASAYRVQSYQVNGRNHRASD